LAFHPYPQLIPQVFNPGGCGPPHGLTRASPWPWVDHPASGPHHATQTPSSDSLSLRLPHTRVNLATQRNSQAHSSKGTPSHTTQACSDGLQAHGFRNSFTPLPGYFSPFPHGTHPLSVTRKYLGLASGPARFTAPSTETLLLGNTTTRAMQIFAYGTLTHSGRPSQTVRLTHTTTLTSRQTHPVMPHNTAHATPARYHTCTV
jgi:hypothetical protein